jgi:hypothetical protein
MRYLKRAPEYKQDFWKITKFLLSTLEDSEKAINNIRIQEK